MTLSHKTTHAREARARLIEQFKGQPRIEATITACAEQTQGDEDAAWSLFVDRWLSSSVGPQLDGIGDVVGEPRGGKDDAAYRLYIAVRIFINLSSGTPDELLTVLGLLAPNNTISLQEFFPASVEMHADQLDVAELASVRTLLGQTKVGGVNLQLEYSLAASDDTFTFASGDEEEASTTQGWQDTATESAANGSFANWTGDDPNDWETFEFAPDSEVSQVGSGESHGGVGTGSCNLYYDGSGDPCLIDQLLLLDVGATYTVEIVISAISGSLHVADVGDAAFDHTYTTIGTKTFSFVAGPNTQLMCDLIGAADVTIDSISVLKDVSTGGVWADVEECR